MTDPRPSASRTAAATAASVAKRRRGRQERLAAELSAEGWHTTPPEKDPIPSDPGVYLSDTFYGHPAVRAVCIAAGPAAIGLWHLALTHEKRTVIDGYAAIPFDIAEEMDFVPPDECDRNYGRAAVRQALVSAGLWKFDRESECYLFLHPGALYAIVGKQGTRDSRTEK